MERLCEDELMCIMQYIPTSMVGVSNERLYNEIKLLDPTFSMVKLYYDLVRWRTLVRDSKLEEGYRLYEALHGYHIHFTLEGMNTRILVVATKDVQGIRDTLSGLGYTTYTEPSPLGEEGMYTEVHIVHMYTHNLLERFARIERTNLFHPIRNIQFRYGYLHYAYGYDVYHERKDDDLYIPRDTYDENLYRAIRAIDPTIDMNVLYDVYMHKYSRENAVRDMYEEWYPYLGNIDVVEIPPLEEDVRVILKEGTDVGTFLEGVPGWKYDQDDDMYTYSGPDAGAMYDRIQTMLRMYYSYSVPRLSHMGVGYYDS